MIFGKIDFINLLPFHVFLKKNLRRSSQRTALALRKGVPSQINRMLESGRIDAAVISSVKSFGRSCTDMGIVAQNEVWSVFVIPGVSQNDAQSDTSNALAKVLEIEGEVMIGDKALGRFLEGIEAVDLGREWRKRYQLPFVFARLCYCRDAKRYQELSRRFLKTRVPIPYYLLRQKSESTGIAPDDIKAYLTKISYHIGTREKRSLRRFRNECRRKGVL
jgi:chorismate dehydratase